jgi:hypothetical protein
MQPCNQGGTGPPGEQTEQCSGGRGRGGDPGNRKLNGQPEPHHYKGAGQGRAVQTPHAHTSPPHSCTRWCAQVYQTHAQCKVHAAHGKWSGRRRLVTAAPRAATTTTAKRGASAHQHARHTMAHHTPHNTVRTTVCARTPTPIAPAHHKLDWFDPSFEHPIQPATARGA